MLAASEIGENFMEEVAFKLSPNQVGFHLAELKERTFHREGRVYAKAGRREIC